MTSTIRQQITLLENTKDELKTAIMEKGVTVYPNDFYSSYPTRISQISMTPGDKETLFKGLVENSITTFDIPVGTEYLGNYSLYEKRLTSLTIPNTVKRIGKYALFNAMCDITIPDSVTFIDDFAFYGNGILSITFESTTPPDLGVNSDTVFGLNNQTTYPIYVPFESLQTYKTAWPYYASRIFPQASPYAVFNSIVDGSVTSLVIPDGVESIYYQAFAYCSNLASVTIPSSVTTIYAWAFAVCTSLVSITCLATTPPSIPEESGNDAFTYSGPNYGGPSAIFVPSASVSAYQSASGWSAFASRIQAIPNS